MESETAAEKGAILRQRKEIKAKNAIVSAVFNTPVSILPTGTVPTPVMEYTS